MSYNGIGLQTARGSGTNGYVTKSKAALRIRDGPPGGQYGIKDFTELDYGPPVHRAPDAAILEHERKRKIEVKCFELQEQLEEEGVDEDDILDRVSELRKTLTIQAAAGAGPYLRPTDSHGIAQAKQAEMSKLRSAFGVRSDYKEGEAFVRETDEEKAERFAQREERDRIRAKEVAAREIEKEKREKERVEREKVRRREEYYKKQQEASKPASSLPPRPNKNLWADRRREDSPPQSGPRDYDAPQGRGRSRSRSPLPYRRADSRSRSRSPSRSPPPKRRRRSPSDSRSPVAKRRARSPTDSRSRSPVRKRSPSPRRRDSRSPSPVRRRRSPSDSRSRSRSRSRSSTPPRRR